MKPRKQPFYEWFMVVEGSGSFPFDMLRYDSCFPLEQQDAAKLEDHHNEKRRVVLCRRGRGDHEASYDRWKSFGWHVKLVGIDANDARTFARMPVTP